MWSWRLTLRGAHFAQRWDWRWGRVGRGKPQGPSWRLLTVSCQAVPLNCWSLLHLACIMIQRFMFFVKTNSQPPTLGWKGNPVTLFYMQDCVRTKQFQTISKVSLTSDVFQLQPSQHLKVAYGSIMFLNSLLGQGQGPPHAPSVALVWTHSQVSSSFL